MDVLVAVVDLNQAAWGHRTSLAASAQADGSAAAQPVLTITSFVDQIVVFFNAFLVRQHTDRCGGRSSETRRQWVELLSSSLRCARA